MGDAKTKEDIWKRKKILVIESDDWGGCETFSTLESRERSIDEVCCWLSVDRKTWGMGTLENVAEMEAIFSMLESFEGRDGIHPLITAFCIVANPDYDNLEDDYQDIGIDIGFPKGWERGDLVRKAKEGCSRGVWRPEYHARFHHKNARIWLTRIKESEKLFDKIKKERFYGLPGHIPEFDGFTIQEQFSWIREGVAIFERAFGYKPKAAVNSDAKAGTEGIWAILGIENFCLRNARLNSGEVTVYHTKPWNRQDIYNKMGTYNPDYDMVSLNRNVFFESPSHDDEEVLLAIERAWSLNEPAILQTHRGMFISLRKDVFQRDLDQYTRFLEKLVKKHPDVWFMTTYEVGNLYKEEFLQMSDSTEP